MWHAHGVAYYSFAFHDTALGCCLGLVADKFSTNHLTS